MGLLLLFRNYLLNQDGKSSISTAKNYLADARHFTNWFEQTYSIHFDPKTINASHLAGFVLSLQKAGYTPATIERHMSSLRKLFQFLKSESALAQSPFDQRDSKSVPTDPFRLRDFKNYLYVVGQKPNTIKNYFLDISQFVSWVEKVYDDYRVSDKAKLAKINSQTILEYTKRLLTVLRLSEASVNRKLSSLRQYCQWAKEKGYLLENPFVKNQLAIASEEPLPKLPLGPVQAFSYSIIPPVRLVQKLIRLIDAVAIELLIAPVTRAFIKLRGVRKPKLGVYIKTASNPILSLEKEFFRPYQKPFITPSLRIKPKMLAILLPVILITISAGLFAYQKFFPTKPLEDATQPFEEKTNEDIFTFSGRLTDSNGNPIAAKQLVIFSFYSDRERFDKLLHQEVHEVSPDEGGFISIQLPQVPRPLLISNTPVYLGIAIQGDAEMRPRQLVSGQESTAALFDNEGKLIIANDSPTIVASSGKFTIKANQLLMQTSSGSDGTIVLSPDGAGKIDILSPLTNSITGVLNIADALAIDAKSGSTPLTLTADSSPIVSVDNKGLLTTKSLAVEGTSSFQGSLTPDLTGTYNIGSSLKMWGTLYANSVIGATTGTQGFWQRKDGTISPSNITDDLLIGATATSSAKIRLAQDNGNITTSGDIAINGGDITTGSSTFTISDGSNALLTIIDNGATADALIQAADFVQLNSYFADEFARDRADLTSDTTLGWGDETTWSLDVNTACTVSTVDDTINGITRLALSASNSCLLYTGSTTSADAHLLFDADNKPVILMKVRPSAISATEDVWVGIGDDTAGSSSPPANGIFFTNNDGTTWTGITRSASTSTTVSCGEQTISTSQFALLKIEVRSTTNVRFFVDPDVSNGISFTECASGSSTNIPTTTLAGMIKSSTTSAAQNLDIDFFRIWQDDPLSESETLRVGDRAGGPSLGNSSYNQQSGADIAENYLSSGGNDIEAGTVVSISQEVTGSVHVSSTSYDHNLIGIVSTNPRGDLILGQGGQGTVRVALLGRVPVKVSGENGPIKPGDYLTSSSTPGIAMKATRAGPTLAKALESFACKETTDYGLRSASAEGKFGSQTIAVDRRPSTVDGFCAGKILVFVSLSWYNPDIFLTPNGDLFVQENTYSGLLAATTWQEKSKPASKILQNIINEFRVDIIEAKRLIVDEIILAKEIVTGRLQATNIITPHAEIGTLQTTMISPLASDTVVIDGKLVAKEASVSGTLRAREVVADNVKALEEKIASLSAIQQSDYRLPSTASNSALVSSPFALSQAEGSTVGLITSDSTLHLDKFFAGSGSFFDGFLSLGPAGFADVSVNGILSLRSTFILSDNSINVLGGDLKLQPLGQGGISIADGKVYIDSVGNLRVDGDVSIVGNLKANAANFSGDLTASGSAQVNKLTAQKLELPQLIEKTKAGGLTEKSKGSVGKGTIFAETYEVTIETTYVTKDSLIYISPTSDTGSLVPYIARQVPGESFTVATPKLGNEDITFNWWIIN